MYSSRPAREKREWDDTSMKRGIAWLVVVSLPTTKSSATRERARWQRSAIQLAADTRVKVHSTVVSVAAPLNVWSKLAGMKSQSTRRL